MGSIHPDAQTNFFDTHEGNDEIIKMFLNNFDIKAAHEKHVANTTVFAYILQPHEYIKETYGFEKDILLVYSPYDIVEDRAIQALNYLFSQYPYVGRVDTLNCFFLSDADDVEEWVNKNAVTENVRTIIPFSKQEAADNKDDPWYIRNKLKKYLLDIDLFSMTLPLKDDKYFFGRQQEVARYINAIKRGQNRGVFGLRKTGKTSLLFKIQRIINEQKIGEVFYYDCKKPSIRGLHWTQLLFEIYSNICERINIEVKQGLDVTTLSRNFTNAIRDAAKKNIRIILFFDEIEFISFTCPIDEHWKIEFVDFWQTIWSVQSARAQSNLSCIISGVNASVSEGEVRINGTKVQNPLMVILQSEYLTGLTVDDNNNMIRRLGKRMGLNFDHEATRFIFDQYGGHPMLTRLACSQIHMHFTDEDRPIQISKKQIEQLLPNINAELVYYFRDVISELQEFYPDEYEMFEMIASGQIVDFMEFSHYSDFTKHLYAYGLLEKGNNGLPSIKLPVAADYVAWELAKKEQRKSPYKLITSQNRAKWVKIRITKIIQDIRQLEIVIDQAGLPRVYGKQSIPEADKLSDIPVADTGPNYTSFINTMHKCLVESIENYGYYSKKKSDYFWTDIQKAYPELFDALYRIKVYRNEQDHLPQKLKQQILNDYALFKAEDTNGFSVLSDQLFAIQQKMLDKLLLSIQIETNKIV